MCSVWPNQEMKPNPATQTEALQQCYYGRPGKGAISIETLNWCFYI